MTPLTPLLIGAQPGSLAEVWLDAPARARHLFIVGQTGTGKTTLLERLIAQDLAAGTGVALLDPHGDLATAAINHLPHTRTNDLILLDPADRSRPIGFNILDDVADDAASTVVESLVTACIHIWGREAIGPQTQMVLRNALRALIEARHQSLLAVPRLLTDADFRERIVTRVHDPLTSAYWRTVFANYDDDFRGRVIGPLQNKLDALLSSDLRNIIGQPRSTIHIPRIMNEGRVLIARLSKGQIGEEPAHLLGALLTTAIANAALARADMPEAARRPFVLYADEFASFASGGFSLILSEARKYALSLCIGTQYLQLLDKAHGLREAVFGNVGTVITFRVGADDAPYLAQHLEVGLIESGTNQLYADALQLQRLPNYTAVGRFLVDGSPTRATDLIMYPAPAAINHRPHRAITHSRERFGRDRLSVDAAAARFLKPASLKPVKGGKYRRSRR